MRIALALAVVLALAGCSFIPPYTRPEAPVPAHFPPAAADEAAAPAATEPSATQVLAAPAALDWRDFLLDARLRAVVELGLAGNRDLRIAALQVQRAGELVRVQRAERSPSWGLQAAGQRYRLPEAMSESGEASIESQYSVDLGFLAWELDLFGRIRSLSEVARESYLATAEGERAVRSSLVAATAGAYLRLAADAESLRLAESTVAARQQELDLVQRSRDAGVASDLELRQAESQLETARLAAASSTGDVAVSRHALELLLGGALPGELEPAGLDALAGTTAIAGDLPSEVLLARPDIVAAEHRLRAVNAQIGAARAAFFPRISLTAALGTLSPELSGLFGSDTHTWQFAPLVQMPLYAGGGPRARLRATRVEREIAVAEYEKAIQVAFAEVADGLARRAALAEQRQALDRLLVALAETVRLAEARFRAGVDGYLGVLVAQRTLYDAQRASVELHLAERANAIALYKALGGGA